MSRLGLSSTLLIAAMSSTMLVTLAFAKDTAGWTTTKVAEGAAGAYCAVSRKVDDVVVTVGRSQAGASSLALEFTKGNLDPQKTYRISLKPGSAERLEVDAQPISPKVFVLNLDQVVDLQKSFADSPTLQLRYDDQSMALGLSNWSDAAKDLGSCLASLKTPTENVATAAKVEKPQAKAVEPKAADKKPAPVEATRVAAVDDVLLGQLQQENLALQDENKRMAETLRSTRLNLENMQQKSNGAPLVELQEKIKWLESQNAELKRTADAAKKPSIAAVDTSVVETLRTERDELKEELAKAKKTAANQKPVADAKVDNSRQMNTDLVARVTALEAENKSLKADAAQWIKDKALLETQLGSARSTAAASTTGSDKTLAAALKTQLEQAVKDNEKLRADNTLLVAKIDASTKTPAKPADDLVVKSKIDDLMAQIDQLSDQNADLKAQLKAKADQPKTPDMAELQQRNETLAAENVKLRGQVAASVTPVDDMKVSVAAELPLRQQLRALRSDNDVLRARNNELMDQLDGKIRGNERELLGASKKNWDLEQATRRSQEAEREVKRLSLTLREDRAKCAAEKKEIEYMLFDPKLAKDGQIALLNSLEDQLAAARAGYSPATNKASVAMSAPPATVATQTPVVHQAKPVTSIMDDITMVPSRPVDEPAVMAEKLAPAVAAVPAAVPVVAPAAPVKGQTLGALLQQAGVQLSAAITPAVKNPFGKGKAWVWESGELAGLSVQEPAVQPAVFSSTVAKQLGTLKSFCKGDFAAQPAGASSASALPYAAYDAACIAGANSTSAAILFYQKDGTFNVISHEAAPDAMDKAMDVRDQILNTIGRM